MPKKPCVGCNQPVPEQGEFPYPDCAGDCPLASAWRKEHVDLELTIAAAREEGRAAGYAEAIERAAKLCDDRSKAHQAHVDAYEQSRDWESMGHQNAAAIASNSLRNAIRKLAPADKEKP